MKCVEIRVTATNLEMKKAVATATKSMQHIQGLTVSVTTDDGVIGFGYVDVFPRAGETPESVRHAIEVVFKPILLGRDLEELPRLSAEMKHHMTGNARAKSAIEGALYDALARSLRMPLYMLLGGRYRDDISLIQTIGAGDPDEMADDAKDATRRGFGLKLKITGDPQLDLLRVARVRDAIGGGVFMKVDANESYDAKGAIRLAKQMADHGVDTFEQPVPRRHLDALWEVTRNSPINIEADQSVRDVEDAYALISNRMVDSISTGIRRIGSLQEVRLIAEMCASAGMRCVISSTAGSMVADAMAVHLVASTPSIEPIAELAGFDAILGDPFTGLRIEEGLLPVPTGDGIGVNPIAGHSILVANGGVEGP